MTAQLTARSGRPTGSSAARRLRAEGRVPGVVYGKGREATPVSVEWTDLRAAIAGGGVNTAVDLELDGETTFALVYELQRHPVKLTIDHIDLLLVERGVAMEVSVPLTLVGEAEEVSAEGAVVEQQLNEIPISAAPANMPAELELDISAMTLERNLTVADLPVPEGVEILLEVDQVLAVGKRTAATIAAEREEAAAEAEELLGDDDPEVDEPADDDDGDRE